MSNLRNSDGRSEASSYSVFYCVRSPRMVQLIDVVVFDNYGERLHETRQDLDDIMGDCEWTERSGSVLRIVVSNTWERLQRRV